MSEEIKNELETTEAAQAVESEVVEVKEEATMENFENEINESFKKIARGDLVEGKIITVTDDELLVDISYISDGIVKFSDTGAATGEVLNDLFAAGDVVKMMVVKTDDGDGNVILSINKANEIIVWDQLEEAKASGSPMLVKVSEAVKGGVVCKIKGVRAFIPASLLSVRYVEDLNEFVGKELRVLVGEVDKDNNKVILSRKAIEQEEVAAKKQELFATIKKNDRFTGTVKKIMNFGAFVDIGGVDGLVHINDLSWEKVKHPSDVVKEGDTVEVYVLTVDPVKEKIGLGLKDVNDDPWVKASETLNVGDVYEGTVERILNFGMFVKVLPGVEGLVHISQVSEDRVDNIEDVFAVGDTVKVAIQSIDVKDKKISLSAKAAKEKEEKSNISEFNTSESATTSLKDVFGDIFKDLD